MTSDANRAWGPISPEQWEHGIGGFTLAQSGGSTLLTGPCPGCGHVITKDLSLVYGAGLSASQLADMRLKVSCNCGELHEGIPASEAMVGCGAWGGVELSVDA